MSKVLFLLILLFSAWGYNLVASDMTHLLRTYPVQEMVEELHEHNWLFSFYDKVISPIDGQRCQMSPTCSVYSREAIHEHGFTKGLIMSFDRLLRCGFDLKQYPRLYIDGIERFLDPIPASKSRQVP